MSRKAKMVCPSHGPLRRSQTKYGGRWGCTHPGCTVSCWEGSTSTPADQETRDLRNLCHRTFDPLWKRGTFKSRRDAYLWLAGLHDIDVADAHFGMFSAEQCRKSLEAMGALTAEHPA